MIPPSVVQVPSVCPQTPRRTSSPLPRGLVLLGCLVCVAGAAQASTIAYTLSGIFSVSLGSTVFTGTAGTFTFQGDTSGVTDPSGNFPANIGGKSSFKLASQSSATFLSSTFGTESEYGAASFMDALPGLPWANTTKSTSSDMLSVYGPAISGMFVSYGDAREHLARQPHHHRN